MLVRQSHRPGSRGRPGQVLTLFTLLLPVLCGMIGLVIDAGLLLAAQRQAQNAADAAALAAAWDKLSGKTDADARDTATVYVQQYNGLGRATVTLNVPPGQGPYAGNSAYVEVIVTASADTWFIQVLRGEASPTVSARAVAGLEAVAASDLVAALDPTASPGLSLSQCTLRVNGPVAVNSQGAGADADGGSIDLGFAAFAAMTSNAVLQAPDIQVVGGVDVPSNYQNVPGGSGPALHAGVLPRSDPLLWLPTPTRASGVLARYPDANGQFQGAPQDVSVTVAGQNFTLIPGVYRSIQIGGAGPGTVTFSPGGYVLLGGNAAGHALQINTGATVQAAGVLFYNTGSDFDASAGSPDSGDGNTLGTDGNPSNTFGDVSISAGQLTLTPLNDAESPFFGMTFYQRRWNTRPVSVTSNSTQDQIAGTIYARWANFSLTAGPLSCTGQFLAGRVSFTGTQPNTTITINPGNQQGKACQVFLVE